MKGIVFTVSKNRQYKNPFKAIKEIDYKDYFHQYGLASFFVITVFLGVFFGAFKAKGADSDLALGLDFLFTTNLQARLSQSVFETFCACFFSDFLFLFAVFLCGLAPWGMAVIPMITTFKGFGVGLCAGYLYSAYGLKGIGFYMLVLLLGIFIFTVALIVQSQNSFKLSKRIFKELFFFKRNNNALVITSEYKTVQKGINEDLRLYLLYSGYMLIMSACAAFADTVLWCFFAPIFNF
ncbi:MAG: hypothetical protein ACI4IS_06745 [Acutalibacteraceae bacterium]